MIEILSLGAGVQSSTVLLMSHVRELPKLSCAIFADTGWEPPAVYRHLDWLIDTVRSTIPVHIVTAGNIRDDHLNAVNGKKVDSLRATIPFYVDTGRNAKEGRTFRKCTQRYKLDPIHQFIRRRILGLRKGERAPVPPTIRHWLGISVDEWRRAKESREKWKLNWFPLIDRRMSRHDCLAWMARHGYPEPPRSACVGCPFHADSEWRALFDADSAAFAEACHFDQTMRHHAALSGTAYLHRSLRPLEEIDLRTDAERGQLSLWDDECEGMCGV